MRLHITKVACGMSPAQEKAKRTAVYLRKDGNGERHVTTVLIRGESVRHVFQ